MEKIRCGSSAYVLKYERFKICSLVSYKRWNSKSTVILLWKDEALPLQYLEYNNKNWFRNMSSLILTAIVLHLFQESLKYQEKKQFNLWEAYLKIYLLTQNCSSFGITLRDFFQKGNLDLFLLPCNSLIGRGEIDSICLHVTWNWNRVPASVPIFYLQNYFEITAWQQPINLKLLNFCNWTPFCVPVGSIFLEFERLFFPVHWKTVALLHLLYPLKNTPRIQMYFFL